MVIPLYENLKDALDCCGSLEPLLFYIKEDSSLKNKSAYVYQIHHYIDSHRVELLFDPNEVTEVYDIVHNLLYCMNFPVIYMHKENEAPWKEEKVYLDFSQKHVVFLVSNMINTKLLNDVLSSFETVYSISVAKINKNL